MSNPWKLWEGQVVNGKLPLFRYIGGAEHCGVFLTERHEGGHSEGAAIKLMPASREIADLQISRWRQAAKLSHPGLIALYEMGCTDLRGVPLVYLVMESSEENLAQVLSDRALEPAEARGLLESVLDVLAYLHREGFVHGRIHPGNILASGEQLKLSSDSLHRAGEPLGGPASESHYDPPEYARGNTPAPQTASPAGDLWSLGITLVEALTQKLPEIPAGESASQVTLPTLPEPFLDIARHCLLRDPEARWNPAQIGVRLQGRIPMPEIPRERIEVPVPPALEPEPEPEPIAASPRPAVAAPTRPATKQRSHAVPIAVGCGVALAGILGVALLLRHHANPPQTPETTAEVPAAPAAPAPTPKRTASKPNDHSGKPTYSSSSKLAQNERSSKPPATVSALAHPETAPEVASNTVARYPAASPVNGEVLHQAPPQVLESAMNSIHGTVRVSVKVNVDRSGNVEDAQIESRGPSKYFARVALEAAQGWKFKPPMVGGLGVLSSWTLRYEFARGRTTVVPTQDLP